jgi:hypothetical protein
VITPDGIVAPDKPGVTFENSLCVFLNGLGEISNVINGSGGACSTSSAQNWQCEYPGPQEFLN